MAGHTLSDRDLGEIERQIDDDTPVYVWTLIRELRASRASAANLLIVARIVAEFFHDTDAPLGQAARTAVAQAEGYGWPWVDRRQPQLADWTGLDRRQPRGGN